MTNASETIARGRITIDKDLSVKIEMETLENKSAI